MGYDTNDVRATASKNCVTSDGYGGCVPICPVLEMCDDVDHLRADLCAAQARIAQLESALADLVAAQNGPPLIRDAATWQAAYDAAVAALDKEVE